MSILCNSNLFLILLHAYQEIYIIYFLFIFYLLYRLPNTFSEFGVKYISQQYKKSFLLYESEKELFNYDYSFFHFNLFFLFKHPSQNLAYFFIHIVNIFFNLSNKSWKQKKMKYESMKQLIFLKGTQRKILELLESKETIQFIDFVDQNNNTPLHYAVSLKYKMAIRKYLQLLKNQELWQQKLEIAQIKMQVVIFRTKNWINSQNNDGMTAMHYAAIEGDLEIAQMLENAGARFDKVTKSGLNAYNLAAQSGKFQSLVFFKGKIDINAKDARGCTALHWSCYKGHQSIVRYLISQNNIQMDFRDNEGKTPLHIATIYDHSKIVQILLRAGANRLIKDKEDKLAQNYAQQYNYQKIYTMLTKKQKGFCSQDSCGSANFEYLPKHQQNCKWIVILFVLLSMIISCNFVLNRTPLHFLTPNHIITLSDYDFVYGWIFFGACLLINAVGFIFGLHIHFKKKKKSQKNQSLSYIRDNINLLDQYCFQCHLIQQQGTSHCNICHKCVYIKIEHSNILGTCIGVHNKNRYLIFLAVLTVVLIFSIVYGVSQLIFILKQDQDQREKIQRALKISIIAIDFLCIIPLFYLIFKIFKAIRMLHQIKQYLIIRKLSETTLDSRSTLVAQKLKAIILDESSKNEEISKKKQKKIMQEQRLSHEEVLLET